MVFFDGLGFSIIQEIPAIKEIVARTAKQDINIAAANQDVISGNRIGIGHVTAGQSLHRDAGAGNVADGRADACQIE